MTKTIINKKKITWDEVSKFKFTLIIDFAVFSSHFAILYF